MAWFGYHNAKDILEQELVAHQKMIAQSAVDAIHTYFTGITENVETLAASGPIRRLLKNPEFGGRDRFGAAAYAPVHPAPVGYAQPQPSRTRTAR